MATVTATHFVSRTTQLNLSGSEAKANSTQITLRNTLSHNGLRAVNSLDNLRVKTPSHSAKRVNNKIKTNNGYLAGETVCMVGMPIVIIGTENAPWSKTGGLGDVLGGLPPALAARQHRVMTIAPRYDQYRDAWDTSVLVDIKVGDRVETVRYFHCYKRGVDRVFVDHPWFLEKVWGMTGSKLYGPRTGEDYGDNQFRYSLFCQAALEAPRVLNLTNKHFSGPYGEDVIFLANDWHSALVPCYLKSMYQSRGIYKNAKVVFCIHNMAYQGRFASKDFDNLNLAREFRSSFDFIDGHTKPVRGRKINWMKAGIIESDRAVTVSPHYAKEILMSEAKGVELHTTCRHKTIAGITNGMDVQEWNPATDKFIDVNYDVTTVMQAKPLLKEALQAAVGLPVDKNIPLIGFIGRLEEQKGSDILVAAIPEIIKEKCQIVVLGTGKKHFEKELEQLEVLHPNNARGVAKFSAPLAHMITAGADFMLIPSRFEPCGLIQLHAMRYGTVPIVASTGGLVDTVKEGFTGFHMGDFNVNCEAVDPADVAAVVRTVRRAFATCGTAAFREMIINCMSQDLSWKEPARQWEKLFLSLGVAGSEPGIEGEEIAPLAKENVATP